MILNKIKVMGFGL